MRSKVFFIFAAVISLIAGLHLLIAPETVHPLIIRGVGLLWLMESVIYGLKAYNKHLKNKLEATRHP